MLDMATLRRILAESNITLLWVTAGLFQEIAGIDPSVFAGERLVMTGGDPVSPDARRAVLAAGAASGLRQIGEHPSELPSLMRLSYAASRLTENNINTIN